MFSFFQFKVVVFPQFWTNNKNFMRKKTSENYLSDEPNLSFLDFSFSMIKGECLIMILFNHDLKVIVVFDLLSGSMRLVASGANYSALFNTFLVSYNTFSPF